MKVFYFYLLPLTAALVFIGGTVTALLKPESIKHPDSLEADAEFD